ncbi:serine/threonine-protein kinase HipA [Sulfitobacter brevis]|uniref:Serine/threonine-protein kinase HipA n=1 Tax=Sulfitobacter brevis TaxID=74348 RepID=A0A1I1WPI1_9RHOB|nr:hypothetical protein [Sulfitobacter brevis]SFD95333.1 serine/threonine-protein kinase HipA [Sulfitobacter brevis]
MARVHGAGLSEFDMLTLLDDATRQGALRFIGEDGGIISGHRAPVPNLMQIDALRGIAVRIEQRREMSSEDLRLLAGAGGSIDDARPKANVQDRDNLWIAKFSSLEDPHCGGARVPVQHVLPDSEVRSQNSSDI